MHMEFAFAKQQASYMQQMALTTPIRSHSVLDRIREIMKSKLSWSDWRDLVYTFAEYCLDEDARYVAIPNAADYHGQREVRDGFRAVWAPSGGGVPADGP
jgi:hypothetical protein